MPYCPQGQENSTKRKLNTIEGKGEKPFPQREWPKTKTKIEKSLEKDNRSQLLPHMGVKKCDSRQYENLHTKHAIAILHSLNLV